MAHVVNQKPLALRIKGTIVHRAWRVAWSPQRRPGAVLRHTGLWLRRYTLPHSAMREDDVVVQVGAPNDLLRVEPCRAAYSEEATFAGATLTLARTDDLASADTGHGIRALCERFGFRNVGMDERGFTAMRAEA